MADTGMTNALTRRQQQVLEFIKEEIKLRDRPPSVREIGKRFGWSSPNCVVVYLKALEKKGKISREPNAGRAITVLAKPPRGIPLLSLQELSFQSLAARGVTHV